MLAPDERTFREHLEAVPYRVGVEDGRWALIRVAWPYAWFAIRAPHRTGAPDAYVLRFELSNYPTQAPTGMPWDLAGCCRQDVADRPKGGRLDKAFRTDWMNGDALYLPCDRVAQSGHDGWKVPGSPWWWDDTREISLYLHLVSEMLMSDEYAGL